MGYTEVMVSVRQLVEFILRSGDIDASAGSLAEIDAMQKGSRMHKKLQKAAGPTYRAEVVLKHSSKIDDDLIITVAGRADGIITEMVLDNDSDGIFGAHEVVTIDEIKGTYQNIGHITEPVPVHLAQAMCYAYFYACQESLSRIGVQVTYAHLEKDQVVRFREEKTFQELEVWYTELVMKYAMWIKWQLAWQEKRNASILDATFPYDYRDGQKKMVAGIYQTILRGKRLFAMAPTGTGKTMASIYPSLKAMGERKADKLFYLTAKTIARTVAESAFKLLQSRGMSVKFITLTAKDKICIFDEAACDPQTCPRAKGHFDRVNEAIFDLIDHENEITRECIERYAEKHQVCPFEFQLDVSMWTDAVICDYNYAFDPDVALKRYFAEGTGSWLFLVDEAHNLVDRAREMYSGQLSYLDFKMMSAEVKGIDRSLSGYLGRCLNLMKAMRDESDEPCELIESAAPLIVLLTNAFERLTKLLKGEAPAAARQKLTDLFFEIRSFIAAFDRSDARYQTYLIRQNGNLFIRIRCIDPSKDLGERLKLAVSTVFFSATLLPVHYYKEMLSDTHEEDFDLYVTSPFDPDNQLVLAAGDVSTRYSRRGPSEYSRIAEYIRRIIRARHGNYMIFFPSYKVMTEVFDIFTQKELSLAGHGLKIVMQESEMDEAARQSFLEAFESGSSDSVIGFCVLGGIFAEGIDLKEDRLIGVIVVGTGLPQVGPERDLLKQYFDEKADGRGFEYAYLYPGMNKVLQAGGRVIRTEQDKGVIALLDERFNYRQYRQLFPKEWEKYEKTSLDDVADRVQLFWTENT